MKGTKFVAQKTARSRRSEKTKSPTQREAFASEKAADDHHRVVEFAQAPQLTDRLVNWRDGLERKFLFEPAAVADPLQGAESRS